MKFSIYIKDPDGIYDSIEDAVREELRNVPGLTDEEQSLLLERRIEEVFGHLERWIKYKEVIVLTVDTDNDIILVNEAKEIK